jgi:hypothetical protein
MRPTFPRYAKDLCAAAAQSLKGQHVIGHALSVPAQAQAICR